MRMKQSKGKVDKTMVAMRSYLFGLANGVVCEMRVTTLQWPPMRNTACASVAVVHSSRRIEKSAW